MKKDAFDFGLAEITNYLYLYERNINFKKSGISKLRDYFYLNVINIFFIVMLFKQKIIIGVPVHCHRKYRKPY